jgi:Ca2+-binding EF-hand superfamily protein
MTTGSQARPNKLSMVAAGNLHQSHCHSHCDTVTGPGATAAAVDAGRGPKVGVHHNFIDSNNQRSYGSSCSSEHRRSTGPVAVTLSSSGVNTDRTGSRTSTFKLTQDQVASANPDPQHHRRRSAFGKVLFAQVAAHDRSHSIASSFNARRHIPLTQDQKQHTMDVLDAWGAPVDESQQHQEALNHAKSQSRAAIAAVAAAATQSKVRNSNEHDKDSSNQESPDLMLKSRSLQYVPTADTSHADVSQMFRFFHHDNPVESDHDLTPELVRKRIELITPDNQGLHMTTHDAEKLFHKKHSASKASLTKLLVETKSHVSESYDAVHEAFSMLGVNNDTGFLDRDMLRELLHRVTGTRVSNEEVQYVIAMCDVDCDGHIGFADFDAIRADAMPDPPNFFA